MRYLTIIGKILTIKTLALSKLICPWNTDTPKVKTNVLIQKHSTGKFERPKHLKSEKVS